LTCNLRCHVIPPSHLQIHPFASRQEKAVPQLLSSISHWII
jgi:hypothetical protein